ncbi:MAG: XRE family transcriptional regulator, partial [Sphingobacteriales bacterium]
MINRKVFFHSNIRFLRERKKMSQEELAQLLDLSRNKLQALESGKTVNPAVADIVRFADHFKVSIDILLKTDLSTLTELKLNEVEKRSADDISGKELRVIVTTVNVNGKQQIEHVPLKAKAGYLSGYGDPEYINRLPVFSLPNLPRDKKFRSFQSVGDSMYPFPEHALIVGEYVDDWFGLRDGSYCIVITRNDGIVFKEVVNRINETGNLILQSLNVI